MNLEALNQAVRALVLLGLLAYFAVALGQGLLEDERARGFGRLAMGAGRDPGVRVLLANRPSDVRDPVARQPQRTWDRLDVAVFQPVEVVTPNRPDNDEHRLSVRAGSYVRIEPDGTDGLILSSPEWGKQHNWPVSVVRVVPRATLPAPEAVAAEFDAQGPAASHPAVRDPTAYEAADRQAVFALAGSFRYRGQLEVVWNSPKDLVAINCLPMEAYLEGVVAVEMSPSYPLEALKAQAIASRGAAYAKRVENQARRSARPRPFDLMDTLDDQEYRGHGNANAAVVRAVLDTRGIVTLVEGVPFAPLFHASSGGHTEAIENVLPGAKDAYGRNPLATLMMAQRDDDCAPAAQALGEASRYWQSTEIFTSEEIRTRVGNHLKPQGVQIGHINQVKVGKRDPRSNRVQTVEIWHTMGDPIVLSGHVFRMLMGPQRLRSTLWSEDSPRKIDAPDRRKAYQITALGYGHGVGMSQISAYQLAKQGATGAAILQRFYGPRLQLVQKW